MPKSSKRIIAVVFLLLILFFTSPIAAHAANLIGSIFIISDDSPDEIFPSIAYNDVRNEYLVVWFNNYSFYPNIEAQRVAFDGSLIGDPFVIASGGNIERRFPDIAYSSEADRYMVVWESLNASAQKTISGRLVSGTGVVLNPADITIVGGTPLLVPSKPAVALNRSQNTFMVVWSDIYNSSDDSIAAQIIDTNGNKEGIAFTISQSEGEKSNPDIAYNANNDRFLVVWQEFVNANTEIMGRVVAGDGGAVGEIQNYTMPLKEEMEPAVTAMSTSPDTIKYIVVYEQLYTVGNHDISALMVNEDGTRNTSFLVTATPYDEIHAAIAACEDNNQIFIAWRYYQDENNIMIRGRRYDIWGPVFYPVVDFPGLSGQNPAIAANTLGDFFTVWQAQHEVGSDFDIYGQLFGKRNFLPMITH